MHFFPFTIIILFITFFSYFYISFWLYCNPHSSSFECAHAYLETSASQHDRIATFIDNILTPKEDSSNVKM